MLLSIFKCVDEEWSKPQSCDYLALACYYCHLINPLTARLVGTPRIQTQSVARGLIALGESPLRGFFAVL
jgi:hypothetical protein